MDIITPPVGYGKARAKVEGEFVNPNLEAAYKAAQADNREAFVGYYLARTGASYVTSKRRYWLKLATYITITSVTLTVALIILAGGA
jgi:hypothetical protein